MDRLMSQSFVRSPQQGQGGGNLPLDVFEQGDNYVVTTPLPGVKPDNVEISVLGDTLRIRAERRQSGQQGQQDQQDQTGQQARQGQQGQTGQQSHQHSPQGQQRQMGAQGGQQGQTSGDGNQQNQRWLMREQQYGFFERMVQLPTPVQADKAQAEFNDGILTITLPKAEHARERKIPVRAGSHGQEQEIPVETGGSSQKSKGSSQTTH
jgi:HSP20 family protein